MICVCLSLKTSLQSLRNTPCMFFCAFVCTGREGVSEGSSEERPRAHFEDPVADAQVHAYVAPQRIPDLVTDPIHFLDVKHHCIPQLLLLPQIPLPRQLDPPSAEHAPKMQQARIAHRPLLKILKINPPRELIQSCRRRPVIVELVRPPLGISEPHDILLLKPQSTVLHAIEDPLHAPVPPIYEFPALEQFGVHQVVEGDIRPAVAIRVRRGGARTVGGQGDA